MITQEQVRDLMGATLVDSSGTKVGKVGQIFLDDQTGQPEWATVNTGMFGSSESFVPLAEAQPADGELRVPYAKDQITDAPSVDIDRGHLDESEEEQLCRHYGLDYSESRSDSGLPEGTSGYASSGTESGEGHDTSGPNTDDAMTRSEERVRAGTETVTADKARLRKWVETEEQQISVPVTKEKAKLVTEPITDANRNDAMAGGDITEEEHEVTLTEERPVVAKETVPVERVKLTKDVEASEETVSETVRKERIGADGDVDLSETDRGRSSR
jgi:uncharacterized protein (TIGR02271 family)